MSGDYVRQINEIDHHEYHHETSYKSSKYAIFDCDDRSGFVRKVLGILSFQLGITFGMAFLSSSNETIGAIVSSPWSIVVAMLLLIPTIIALFFFSTVVPLNYLLLLGFTFGESILVSSVSA